MRKIALLPVLFLLAACGTKAPLVPTGDAELPPEPYGETYRPDAEELLEPSEQAVPQRNVELRERSEEREDDPFDLPPE